MAETFIKSSIGLRASHRKFKAVKLVRAEFFRVDSKKVRITIVSGHTLEPMGTSVMISKEAWLDCPENPYDDSVLAIWALEKCGWEVVIHA